jgi:hypothetical protein
MKKILSAIFISGLMLASCEFHHPEVVVLPDPSFDVSGLQEYDAISIYEDVPIILNLSRVYGVSKEIELNLTIDESLITEHNELYSATYTLMPNEYYECPTNVTFNPNTKTAELDIKVYVDKLVDDKGLATANKMVIPILISSASEEIEDAASMGNVLVKMKIDTPQIEVNVPETKSLEFISAFPVSQTVRISAATNFTTLDTDKVTFAPAPEKVAEFNMANNTSHVMLPTEAYQVKAGVFDAENLSLLTDVVFDCASLTGVNTYILPLEMIQESEYEITQSAPVYVIIELTELKISVVGGGELMTIKNSKGTMTAKINSPITSDFDINFMYDPSKVSEYNAANGTSFVAPDASKVTITASQIPEGTLEGNVEFAIEWADKAYDDGQSLLLPLTLDGILEGTTIVGNPTVYVELVKTLSGNWTYEKIEPMYPAAIQSMWTLGTTIWLADGKTPVNGVTKNPSDAGHKYVFIYGGVWTDGIMYFDVDFENELADKPGCYPIINFQDRVQAGWPGGYDTVTSFNSYFDSVNEEFVFDFTILGWWGPGGGGGEALQDPSHVPGYGMFGKLHSKQ